MKCLKFDSATAFHDLQLNEWDFVLLSIWADFIQQEQIVYVLYVGVGLTLLQ